VPAWRPWAFGVRDPRYYDPEYELSRAEEAAYGKDYEDESPPPKKPVKKNFFNKLFPLRRKNPESNLAPFQAFGVNSWIKDGRVKQTIYQIEARRRENERRAGKKPWLKK
jgi:hypothetical protein